MPFKILIFTRARWQGWVSLPPLPGAYIRQTGSGGRTYSNEE